MSETVRSNDLPRVWVLADDRPGNRSQCLGVARVLGLPFECKEIAYGPLVRLHNAFLGASFAAITDESLRALTPPWPDLVIGAGRRSASVARKIKRLSGGRTRLVHIMHPGAGAADFDLIAQPAHDARPPAPNILSIPAAPHGVTTEILGEAAEEWKDAFAHLPRPLIALMVGGSTRRREFGPAMAAEVASLAAAMAKARGGSLLVSTSRRVEESEDPATMPALLDAFADLPNYLYRWGDPAGNPYMGYLAHADTVVVTGDSVSMSTEACARPGPVYLYAPAPLITPKHKRFHDFLFQGGYARPLTSETVWEDWTHPPLNPAEDVARAIREMMRL
ncbi:MAG: nucleoside-diphosphate sugar epimerase [Rhodospirillales bacterium CG15_BIG_FIL_POST_REV_8_21_14_020_66_15]|nr:MAG: nucleoside-diphosphate sugar epimerase [Rhodospirillales bacterium CG15_BIG_FIL_POST_REV_8_21_14_020_66_15]